tara:strand:- start:71838 stop:72074 length:237 start_codon:yes stop_codon:yes gene_type:complete
MKPTSLSRAKHFARWCADVSEKRHALQAVGRRAELTERDDWGARKPRTRMVAIGSVLDSGELIPLFETCLQQEQQRQS